MISPIIPIGRTTRIGDPAQFTVIAGPCSIESLEQLQTTAAAVKHEGATILRGGMFKMRTNPESFQGLGASAFEIVRQVKAETGLAFVSEITDPRQIPDLVELVDMFQVGSRNMYNYALLKELGQYHKPVFLKRGFSALVDEWIHAAEYVAQAGKAQVVLCERGIRTFETKTRNTLDLNAVAYIKKHTSLPVIVDPSHGTGRPELIAPMAMAAAAAGADGIMVEIHPNPSEAKSDGFQALTFAGFTSLMADLRRILPALNRSIVGL
jgi:3-deoxy-7-phosphoheptulonate synthase